MPAALDVNKEAIRLLVVEHGITETAKQTNIPLNTLLSWSARGKWLKPTKPQLPPTVQPRAINAISPHVAQANTLEAKKQRSRSNLAKFVVNASQVAAKSRSPLADAQNVRHVASVAEHLWPSEKVKTDPGLISVALIRLELPANVREERPATDPLDHAKVVPCHELP